MRKFVRKAAAFLKRDTLENASYRFGFVLDLVNVFATLLTFFFIAKLLDGGAPSLHLKEYGNDYFTYVLIGLGFAAYQTVSLGSISTAIGREQQAGTLEAILLSPTSLEEFVLLSSLWNILYVTLQIAVRVLIGVFLFQAQVNLNQCYVFLILLPLTLASFVGLGAISGGFVLAFKKGDPVAFLIDGGSKFFSGVYFPVTVLPLWLHPVSNCLPMTHFLEAARKLLIRGESIGSVWPQLLILAGFAVILLPAGVFFLRWALERSRRDGSLNFY
jgi:ABC-2 type transport system permease protein